MSIANDPQTSVDVLQRLTDHICDAEIVRADAHEFIEGIKLLDHDEQVAFERIISSKNYLLPALAVNYFKKKFAATLSKDDWMKAVGQEVADLQALDISGDEILIQISKDTVEKIKDYYLSNPGIAVASVELLEEAESLLLGNHASAAHVFSASACELMIKTILLRPLVSCSIGYLHDEVTALITDSALSQTGYSRYQPLLAAIFKSTTQLDLLSINRLHNAPPLIREALAVQSRRNKIVHQGLLVDAMEAKFGDVPESVERVT